jgi:hypothetical protein
MEMLAYPYLQPDPSAEFILSEVERSRDDSLELRMIMEVIEEILFAEKRQHQQQIRKVKKLTFFLSGIDRRRG